MEENDTSRRERVKYWCCFFQRRAKCFARIIIRARARWHEHGEKSTKYFLNLEKRNHVKKHIRKLVISGVVKTDPFDILQEQTRFYRELYKSSNSDAENRQNIVKFLENLNIPQLTEEQMLTCEGKISAEECYNILESFQSNKTPGNDGIPIEFYKLFWPLISDPFLKCVNESFEKGEMSCSQKQAVITLIEKKGKDRSYIENWRPISLVNVDTKVMSKVIATRMFFQTYTITKLDTWKTDISAKQLDQFSILWISLQKKVFRD